MTDATLDNLSELMSAIERAQSLAVMIEAQATIQQQVTVRDLDRAWRRTHRAYKRLARQLEADADANPKGLTFGKVPGVPGS